MLLLAYITFAIGWLIASAGGFYAYDSRRNGVAEWGPVVLISGVGALLAACGLLYFLYLGGVL